MKEKCLQRKQPSRSSSPIAPLPLLTSLIQKPTSTSILTASPSPTVNDSPQRQLSANIALDNIMRTAVESLLRNRRAGSNKRIILLTPESLGVLRIPSIAIGASHQIIFLAIEHEVLVAETLTFRGDGDGSGAGAGAFDPGDVEVGAALSPLVADGDGDALDGGEGGCEEHE
ncbi:MAG: hypothetical protein M1831_005165 [Alyxoria varia]|nr:MAG: hypothetical protein M1831_005165 [Alyxoria varia]